ncbi:hypothetical protein GIB67_028434, partial [Kingdonia uniflora]
GYPEINDRGLDLRRFGHLVDVPQSNEPFENIPADAPLSNEHNILQSNAHLSNEPMLINVIISNELMLTNVPLSIEPEPIIGKTEPSAELQFEYNPNR